MVPHATKVPVPPTTGFLISHWVSSFYVEHAEHALPTHHHYFLNPTGGSTHFCVDQPGTVNGVHKAMLCPSLNKCLHTCLTGQRTKTFLSFIRHFPSRPTENLQLKILLLCQSTLEFNEDQKNGTSQDQTLMTTFSRRHSQQNIFGSLLRYLA
jgi:hypothetical protein